ncbi:MAG: diguanylate cyclase [Anaerolineales bacterium]|nr:diguanylate cyclase [Anaerolineales bacterium]
MFARPDIYVPLIYIIAAIPYALLGLYAWRRRPAIAVTSFAWAMLSMSIWTFGYSLEVFFPSLEAKLLFTQIEYFGIVSAPLFMTFFAFEYTGNSHLLTSRVRSVIWLIPVITLFLVWTHPLHNLMWTDETVEQSFGLTLLSVRFGVFFWIQTIYSYSLLVAANVLLVRELIRQPHVYRAQISLVAVGILIPLVGSVIFVTGIGPIRNLDLAPVLFMPTALALFWAIKKYRLLDILPPEHINVLKTMRDGVIVLNPQERILYLNPTAEALFHFRDDEAVGQPLSQVSEDFHETLKPYLFHGEQRVEVRTGGGKSLKVFEATIIPVLVPNSTQAQEASDYMVTLHDVTENKEVELALTRREAIMSAISYAATQFLRTSAWEGNIPEVLEKLGQAADVSRVFVVMNYANEQSLILSSLCFEWVASGITPLVDNPAMQHISLEKTGFRRWVNAFSQGIPIYGQVSDFPEEEQDFLKILSSFSLAAIPIFVERQWWGFIVFEECREERDWTGTELEAFYAAASIFGAAEDRARSEQKLIRRQHVLSLLHQIVAISLQADDIKEMARVVVERLGDLIDADGCFITLWDEAAEQPIPLASYGAPIEVYTSYKPNQGDRTFTGSALQTGRTLIVEDTSTTHYAEQHIIEQFPSRSVLVLPLIANQKKLGAVILTFNKSHHFLKDEISICEQASALIALALEKFQAVEEARRRAETSENLRKASLAIVEKLEMDQAVKHILEQLNQVVPYDSATVQLLEENALTIIGGHGWKELDNIIGMRFIIPGENPNSVVIETGKPYYLPEAGKVYKDFNEPPHNHIRSWLGVPLIAQEKTIGLLTIDSAEPNDFSEEDIKTATEFANQVAVALENARIFSMAREQAIIDSLTEIYNRRGLLHMGQVAFDEAKRANKKFSAIMVDIDHFKSVNDTYGHEAGDKILRQFALQCKNCVRDRDLVGRYGGEEIVILLPNTDLTAGLHVAKRLRKTIAETFVNLTEDIVINFTVSLGVACTDENTDTLDTLINRADQAMYVAKHNGRDRVEYSL